jgi:hypothetical protein
MKKFLEEKKKRKSVDKQTISWKLKEKRENKNQKGNEKRKSNKVNRLKEIRKLHFKEVKKRNS